MREGGREGGRKERGGRKRDEREREKGGSNTHSTNVMFPTCLFTMYMHE